VSHAGIVSYDTSDWDHGSGSQQGWNDGELQGTTTVLGRTLTVTSNRFGTAQYTADHLSRIDETFFSGFAFQLQPASTDQNAGVLTNYARIDFSFSSDIHLDSYTLTDVDRANGQWYDVIAVEAFGTTTPGALGTGFTPDYTFENPSNLGTATLFGLNAAGPLSNTGNVQNTPENDVTFSFSESIRSFSIYYWNFNNTDNAAGTQTIGTRGNAFTVSSPEPSAATLLAVWALMTAPVRRRRVTLVS
jgi:hypothetical protein